MDDDDNDYDLGALILANTREWNGFWFWRDKPVGERGAAREVLEAAKVEVTDLRSLDQDPPDCEATLDGPIFWHRGDGTGSPAHARTIHQGGETACARRRASEARSVFQLGQRRLR